MTTKAITMIEMVMTVTRLMTTAMMNGRLQSASESCSAISLNVVNEERRQGMVEGRGKWWVAGGGAQTEREEK